MKKAAELINECISRNLHCSITYQRINDFSIEIYRGYKTSYEKVFYTDGHIKPNKAIKEALNFLYTQISQEYVSGITFENEAIRKHKCTYKSDNPELNGLMFWSETLTKRHGGLYGKWGLVKQFITYLNMKKSLNQSENYASSI